MPRATPTATLQAEKRASVRTLHAQGMSATAIAQHLGVHVSTVSRWAKADGVEFDRAHTKAATQAAVIDAAKLRAELQVGLLEDVAKIRRTMWEPGERVAGNGQVVQLTRADSGDVKNWMTAAGIAIQRSLELAKADVDPHGGMSAVDDWLQHMTGGAGAIPTPVREVADSDLPIDGED